MGDDAILALVDARGRDHDHLALGLAQAAGLLHQRVMIGEEGAELVRPARQREKDVGNEARLFLHRCDPLADVLGRSARSGAGNRLIGGLVTACLGLPHARDGPIVAALDSATTTSRHRPIHGPAICSNIARPASRGARIEAPHAIWRLHLRRDPARSRDRRAGRRRQSLRRRPRADRARRPRRARCVRARRTSSAGLCGVGAGGGAGRGRRAHQAHPLDQRGDGAVVRRSGAGLSAIRDARSHLGRPRRDHGRARLVHRILSAVRLRPRRLRRIVRGEARSPAANPRRASGHWKGRHRAPLDGQGVYPRALQQPLPVWIASGGTPQSVARAGALGLPLAIAIIGGEPARFAPLADLYREAGRRAGVAPEKLQVGINGHGFLADTAEAAVDAFFRLMPR